jgi:hypothetical protein
MNDVSRFTVVLNEMKAYKLKKLPELFISTLRETLSSISVNPDVIDRYIADLGNVRYAKNSDRKKTAQLNRNTNDTWWALRSLTNDVDLSFSVNQMIYNTSGTDEVLIPAEAMLDMLSIYGLPTRKIRAFDLNVRLDLNGKDAVRRLRVPASISFQRLHRLLQTAFGWLDYHLYSFGMFEEWSDNYYAIPDVELTINAEEDEANPDSIEISGLKLSDYVPKYRKILYRYDFGDDWHHYIEVENIIEDCSDNLPVLLAGSGDAPPEDVGGPGGFADFLEIISDPAHEEHEHMLSWSKSLWWKPFDFDSVARRIGGRKATLSVTATDNTVNSNVKPPEKHQRLPNEAVRILDYMKSHPDQWGFVIADSPFGYCCSCGNPARVCIDDNQANEIGNLCDNCYNKVLSELTGSPIPDIVPKQISVKGRGGKTVEFELEFFIFQRGMMLEATEIGKRKRRAGVRGEHGDDFDALLETLKQRITKALSVTYIDKDGYINGDKAVGYIEYNRESNDYDIYIDGYPFTWSDLEKNISAHEGWKVKIEFACIGDELE